jgi:hypothetical protein
MYENALGKGLAQSIVDAFKEAGWDQAELLPGSGLGDGVVTGWGESGAALKSALDAARDLHTWVKDPMLKSGGDLAIIGVGINSSSDKAPCDFSLIHCSTSASFSIPKNRIPGYLRADDPAKVGSVR